MGGLHGPNRERYGIQVDQGFDVDKGITADKGINVDQDIKVDENTKVVKGAMDSCKAENRLLERVSLSGVVLF